MKVIYKKRLSSPIKQIIAHGDTFSYITRTNKQYTHPDTETRLPFTPDQFVLLNGNFFYLHRKQVFFKVDAKYQSIKLPNKTHCISTSDSYLLLADKKVIKMEFVDGRYKMVDQLYGPSMHISSLSFIDEKLLAISYGDPNIYLFNKNDHLVFKGRNLMVGCCLIDADNFVVAEGTTLYYYHGSKASPMRNIDVEHEISVISSGLGGIFVGCVDGHLLFIENAEIVDSFMVEGTIKDIKVRENDIIVASGYERGDEESAKKVRNYLTIFNR